MSYEAIQQEVATWPDEQIRRIQAFLVALRFQRESGNPSENQDRWIPKDEVAKELGLGPYDDGN